MRRRRSATATISLHTFRNEMRDLPCDANGLRHLKGSPQRLPVCWRNFFNPQPSSNKDQSWLKYNAIRLSDIHETILIHIRAVSSNIDAKIRIFVIVCQGPGFVLAEVVSHGEGLLLNAACSGRWPKPFAWVLPTSCCAVFNKPVY